MSVVLLGRRKCQKMPMNLDVFFFYRKQNTSSFLQAWMPTIKKHNCRSIAQQTTEGTTSGRTTEGTTPSQPTEGTTSSPNNNEDRNAPIAANQGATYSDT